MAKKIDYVNTLPYYDSTIRAFEYMLYEFNLNAPKLDIIEMHIQYPTNALPCMIDVRRQINFK